MGHSVLYPHLHTNNDVKVIATEVMGTLLLMVKPKYLTSRAVGLNGCRGSLQYPCMRTPASADCMSKKVRLAEAPSGCCAATHLVLLLHRRCSVGTGQLPSVVCERRSVRRTSRRSVVVAQYDLQEPKGFGYIVLAYRFVKKTAKQSRS